MSEVPVAIVGRGKPAETRSPSSARISFRMAALVVAAIAAAQLALQMGLLARGVGYAAASLVIDDTYYYLQTAWNTRHTGLVTFDDLHTTNGVQLFWFVVVLSLAFLAKTKTSLLFATLAVAFLLNALCHWVILKIGLVLKRPDLALLMAGLWSLQSLPFRIYSTGMENSLHALVFWGVVWQAVVFLVRARRGEEPNFGGLTLALVLNAWTRLDSALLSAVVFLFCVGALARAHRHSLWPFLQRHAAALLGSSALGGLGFIAQLIAFWVMGGSVLPVSALVKTSGAGWELGADTAGKFAQAMTLGMPSILQGRFPAPVLVVGGIAGIWLAQRARAVAPGRPDDLWPLRNLWAALLIGELFYHVFIAASGAEYTPYFMWYRSPSFIFWIITGCLIALRVLERIHPAAHRLWAWAPPGLSLLAFAAGAYLFARSIDFASGLYAARHEAARWIAENTAPDAVFASWNAGQLAFFSDRTVINLDGVVNDVAYYERVLRGPVSLADYLQENGVDYVVDYATYAPLPDYPVAREFPIGDGSGRSIHIWRVSPEISSTP